MEAYLCIVTWPDGTEGLLFPRPGNVQIATTPEMGAADFETACRHLQEYKAKHKLAKNKITLKKFSFVEDIKTFEL